MKQKSLTKLLPLLVIVTIGILFINSNLIYGQVVKEKEALTKTVKIWVVDPLVDIQPDALPENWHWYFSVTACQGEYESAQIAIRTDEKRVTINVEATDLIQVLGDKLFDVKNLQLRLIEYLPNEVRETLMPIPGSFVLEPHRTHALRLTAYVPKEQNRQRITRESLDCGRRLRKSMLECW